MEIKYAASTKNKIGTWLVFGILFMLWTILFLTSDNIFSVYDWLLLIVLCSFMPIILTFFVYVTINDDVLTVPMTIFFRKSISIKNIQALNYRLHGLGFMYEGIEIQYLGHDGISKNALLPSLTVFGKVKTSQIINKLIQINQSIKIDPEITSSRMRQ